MTELEKSIVNKFKTGDKKAFEYIFKLYYNQLCLFAQSIVLVKESAEDLVKDFFVSIWENHKKINIKTSLKGYLYQGIKNRCLNFVRDNKQNPETSNDDEQIELLYKPVDSFILEKIYSEELKDLLIKTINEFPEQRKTIFKLSRYDNLSHAEIAKKLNISPNTVKVQIYRALMQIRASFEKNN